MLNAKRIADRTYRARSFECSKRKIAIRINQHQRVHFQFLEIKKKGINLVERVSWQIYSTACK
jgi:hypothetical protein